MNNIQIEKTLNQDFKVRDSFVGVFPCDKIPEKEFPGGYIVNTQPSGSPGEHWVAFYCVSPGVLEAFDSYGNNPAIYSIHLKDWIDTDYLILSNTVRQNTDTTVCGQYCMFYILLRCYGFSYKDVMSALTRNKNVNDKFVCKFINKFFSMDTNVRDVNFINELLRWRRRR